MPLARTRRFRLPGRGQGDMAAYEVGPEDAALAGIFVHANGFNAATYLETLESIAVQSRWLAVDQRGHGRTTLATVADARTDWLDLRDDLLALIEVLNARDLVLSGHSMGGTVSLLASAEMRGSDRVARLVLFDPVILPAPLLEGTEGSPMVQGALRRRARFSNVDEAFKAYRGRGAFRTWPDDTLSAYLSDGLRPAPEGPGLALSCSPQWEASNYAAQGHDSWAALSCGVRPIDIFTSETGSTFRREAPEQERLEALAPRVTVQTVVGASHFLPMERPDLVKVALSAALAHVRAIPNRT